MLTPGRTYTGGTGYRYGFNGKENDNEVKGEGNSYDFGSRIYDSRLGRWLSIDPLFKNYVPFSPYCFSLNSPLYFIDGDGNEVIGPDGKKIDVSEKNGSLVFSDNADLAAKLSINALYITPKGKALFQKLQASSTKFMFKDYDKQLKAAMNNASEKELGFASSKALVETAIEVYKTNEEVTVAANKPDVTVEELKEGIDKLKAVKVKIQGVVGNEAVWDEQKGVSVNKNASTMYLVIDFAFYNTTSKAQQLTDINFKTKDTKKMLESFILGELLGTIAEESSHGLQKESNFNKPVGSAPPYKKGPEIPYEKRKHEIEAKKQAGDIQSQYYKQKVASSKKT